MPRATPDEAAPRQERSNGGDARFRRRERLRKRRDIVAVQRRGARHYTPVGIFLWVPGPCPWTRLGVTASRKVGTAVKRNRAKRLLREAFRRNKLHLPNGLDLVVIASTATAAASYGEVERALLSWARRAATQA